MEILDIEKGTCTATHTRAAASCIGQSADGVHAVIAYFIMGRSANSRNRVFVEDGRRHPHPGV